MTDTTKAVFRIVINGSIDAVWRELTKQGEPQAAVFNAWLHAQALQVGGRVCQRVRDADIAHAGSPTGRLTASVGVATLQPDDAELEDVLRRADAALYRVKAAGRDGVAD